MLRPFAAGTLTALLAFALVHASGCGTDAVGIEECRDIEDARCEAGRYCEDLIDDVEACKRFYRDQCLHGLASGERPGSVRLKACVNVITSAGDCAKNGVKSVADCAKIPAHHTALADVCDVIKQPEAVKECDFLGAPVEVPDAAPDTTPSPDASDGASDASDAAAE
jgi:hypothetical protein